jgi:hypothetical protein
LHYIGFCLRHELGNLFGRHVSLTLATDSQTLFNAFTLGSSTSKRLLLVDLAAFRQGYRAYEVDDIVLVRSSDNLSEAVTKRMEPSAIMEFLHTGQHVIPAVQRIHCVRCYTRATPSYKLLSEYNLLLTQRLTIYPLVLVGLYCGSSSFAGVTNELPLIVLWLLCVAGTYLCS